MNTTTTAIASVRLLTLAALSASLLTALPVQARERQAQVSANGQSATRHVQRVQGDVSTSTVNAQGKTVGSRNVDRSAEATNASATGPKGGTATRETTRTSEGSSTTVTGSGGKTATVEVSR